MAEHVTVIGLGPGGLDTLGKPARAALEAADLVVGGARHLELVGRWRSRRELIEGDVASVLDTIEGEPGQVCVLASGDPGFFGILRALVARVGRGRVEVHPAPSSVALAFARLGLPWDDAAVVSAHGRPLEDAARAAASLHKVALLVAPDASPADLGSALVALGAPHEHAAICSRLGLEDERVVETDLAGLAGGAWDPLSVVVLWTGSGVAPEKTLGWGLPDGAYQHRAGMVTKAEVRAVVIGKLDLPPAGVLWDVGAGSGSVAIECARLAPGLRVTALERDPDAAARVRANAAAHGAAVTVVEGTAPGALAGLPDPDRVFVGGGGIDVLDAVLARLASGGRAVGAYAALDRAAAAAERLGSLVEVQVNRGERLPGGGMRLVAGNPVFVAWGPGA